MRAAGWTEIDRGEGVWTVPAGPGPTCYGSATALLPGEFGPQSLACHARASRSPGCSRLTQPAWWTQVVA